MRQPSLAHVCILTLLAALTACGAVPAGALLGATEVTMTPLATLTGVPVEGRAHGVLLEPSGLRLFEPATLEVAPADATTGNAIGYAASVDGSDFHLVPPLLGGDRASVSFRLFGFSQHGGFTGTNSAPITMSESPEAFSPANWEAQLQHMLAELYSAERHSQLSGAPGTVKRSWAATALLGHPDPYDSTTDFKARTAAGDAIDGTFRVADALNPPGGDPVSTAGAGALGSANFNVRLDTEACTFTAGFQTDGPATTIGPDGETRHNLTIGTVNLLEQRVHQGGMGTSQELPHSSAAGGRSHFSYGQSAGSLPMRGAEGTALVTWTLSPVGAP